MAAPFAIVYTATAKRDLEQIDGYLTREAGPTIAKAVLARIRSKIRTLQDNAVRYRVRKELLLDRRVILIGSCLAVHQVRGSVVIVERVLHSARSITDEIPGQRSSAEGLEGF